MKVQVMTLPPLLFDFPSRASCADAAASSQSSMAGVHYPSDTQLPLDANAAPESAVSGGSGLNERQSLTAMAAGVRESTDALTDPVDGPAAQPQEASGGGVANDSEAVLTDPLPMPEATVPVSANSKTADNVDSQHSIAPSLPPFLKDTLESKGPATAVQPTVRVVDEVNTVEVVDNAQISGVGFADTSDTSGCKCLVM